MPQAVTHLLVAIIIVSLFRDFYVKSKEKFPLHYVLIAGLGGVLPDIDFLFFYGLSFFGAELTGIHRTFTHSLFFLLIFIILGLVFSGYRNKELGRHHLKLNLIFYVLAFGIAMHLFLDWLFAGYVMIFYPFLDVNLGLNLINFLPTAWQSSFSALLDGVLIVFYMIYLEVKHKLSDFI